MLNRKKKKTYINKGMFCAWDSCTTSFSYKEMTELDLKKERRKKGKEGQASPKPKA